MLYKRENNCLETYEVKIDTNKLKMLREEIIDNCSIIESCRGVFATVGPICNKEKYIIKNFVQEKLAYIQENMGWPDTSYYEYSYDKYYFPEIIKIIDDILNGNEEQIELLFETEDLIYDINEFRKVDDLYKMHDLIDLYIKTNDKKILDLLKVNISKFNHVEIIKPLKSIKEYYDSLKSCFEFEKINTKDLNELELVQNLFGEDWKTKLNEFLILDSNISNSVNNQYIKKFMH